MSTTYAQLIHNTSCPLVSKQHKIWGWIHPISELSWTYQKRPEQKSRQLTKIEVGGIKYPSQRTLTGVSEKQITEMLNIVLTHKYLGCCVWTLHLWQVKSIQHNFLLQNFFCNRYPGARAWVNTTPQWDKRMKFTVTLEINDKLLRSLVNVLVIAVVQLYFTNIPV